jgi:hypothetical protein
MKEQFGLCPQYEDYYCFLGWDGIQFGRQLLAFCRNMLPSFFYSEDGGNRLI